VPSPTTVRKLRSGDRSSRKKPSRGGGGIKTKGRRGTLVKKGEKIIFCFLVVKK